MFFSWFNRHFAQQVWVIWLRERFVSWLAKRIPAADVVKLNHRRIFILPTGYGAMFMLLGSLLFFAGISYQNNLLLAFSFFMVSIFLTCILHTFYNLSGLSLLSVGSDPVPAGAVAVFNIQVSSAGSACESIEVGFLNHPVSSFDVLAGESLKIGLKYVTTVRGRCKPGRLYVQSRYPFGMLRTWSWIDLNMSTLVYPSPVVRKAFATDVFSDRAGRQMVSVEGEEFEGLKPYLAGDSLKRVNWKLFAKTDELYTKEYSLNVGSSVWIDWWSWPQFEQEQRLSVLTYWVLFYAASNRTFGLKLPSITIAPAAGNAQKQRCLKQLAVYDLPL